MIKKQFTTSDVYLPFQLRPSSNKDVEVIVESIFKAAGITYRIAGSSDSPGFVAPKEIQPATIFEVGEDPDTREYKYVSTYTGYLIDPCNPDISDIDPLDIAHSLSMQCRFNGHTSNFYSVAEHSIIVSLLVNDKHALQGLLHDAAEAYVGDLIKPVKPLIKNFNEIETRLLTMIYRRFKIHPTTESTKDVDYWDKMLCTVEYDKLVKKNSNNEKNFFRDMQFQCLSPGEARSKFMSRLILLKGE